ncbi:MAG TPA: ABC transporter substrate-binding protein [Methylomirabilota bacterium]|jgi:branched-chain amino acid transport system substrate-binding protein|nr:ABC transporter substrate-binding protein [Methylomirabilota bacterium]
MTRLPGFLALLLVAALSLLVGPAAAQDVRIGTIFPMTGNMAFGGNEGFTGTDIAREIVNERGGVWGGKKIVFVTADAPDQTAATNEMNRLISHENVKLVVGSYSSAIAFTASAVAERNKVVFWENHGVADTIARRGFKYLFKSNVNATGTGGGAATFAATYLTKALNTGAKELRVAVAWEDGTYGASVGKAAFEKAKELGLNVLANEGYSAKAADLSPLILKLKGLNPDVLLVAGIGQDAVLFWNQAKKLDLNVKAVVATSGGWGVPDFAKNLGEGANGVFSSDFPTEVNPNALTPRARELAQEFIKRFQAKKGTRPTGNAWLAFAGTMVLFEEVLPKAGSLDAEKIRTTALALDLPVGSMANGCGVKFIPHDQFDGGKNERAFAIVGQWQDGVMRVVAPENLATNKPILVPLPKWSERK